VKSGQYVADVIIEGIEMVGPENVVQVTTDSAPNCKVGGASSWRSEEGGVRGGCKHLGSLLHK
jgi:hypothetical protein